MAILGSLLRLNVESVLVHNWESCHQHFKMIHQHFGIMDCGSRSGAPLSEGI